MSKDKSPLYLTILWHMHQPFYKNLITQEYILPWVRMHAVKDYYDMPAILKDYPSVRQNFNLVPSLMVQLEDYKAGRAQDVFLKAMMKEAAKLTIEEKVFLLKNFFLASYDHMIRPYPRYWELLQKRGLSTTNKSDLLQVQSTFSTQDYRDLQVWFHLAWCGNTLMGDKTIKRLLKAGNFSESDKRLLLDRQDQLLSQIVPLYKELSERGQIEISTTPFYHPILPLLCDTELAKASDKDTPLPDISFRFPQDAEEQVCRAVELHQNLFGSPPAGLWPSEGSVAEEIIPIVARAGIRWMASDEEILKRSLASQGSKPDAAPLCQPYRALKDGERVAVFFRNHHLSDLIGFVYSKWNGRDAAHDLMRQLYDVRNALPQDGRKYIVSIILDGENAWENYPQNGKEFLHTFYQLLSESQDIKTITFSDYLREQKELHTLPRLHPGSWIYGSFRTWIGHREKNQAWECLYHARKFLGKADKKGSEKAWESVLIAEGSDWFWWLGDDHQTETAEEFDFLFRQHLKNVYHYVGESAPPHLNDPIKQLRVPAASVINPTGLMTPKIDGRITSYYEWASAGSYKVGGEHGSMHQVEKVVKEIYLGYDRENVYLRIDTAHNVKESYKRDHRFVLSFEKPHRFSIELKPAKEDARYGLTVEKEDRTQLEENGASLGADQIIEISVPLDEIGVREGDEFEFVLSVYQKENELERWPRSGAMRFEYNPTELEQGDWSV